MEPILYGVEKEKAELILDQIIKLTVNNHVQSLKPGLFTGKAGISFFLFHCFRIRKQLVYEETAFKILQEVLKEIEEKSEDHSYFEGLNGICCAIEYLAQNGFIENNAKDILLDIDKLYLNPITNLLDYSLNTGIVSYGMYFLSRITNPNNPVYYQKEILMQIINYLEFYIPEYANEVDDPENLTITKGYLAIIPFLCWAYKANVHRFKVTEVLIKCVDFIKQQENRYNKILRFPDQTHFGKFSLRWDSGDLAFSHLLLQVAKTVKNDNWESNALEIALRTTSIKKIENENISIFNGTAGIAHLYNRLYQHYKNPELKLAAVFWLNRTLVLLENSQFVEYGLTNGIAGAGMVIMNATSDINFTWDRLLLMS